MNNNGKTTKWIIGTLITIMIFIIGYLFTAFNHTENKVEAYQSQMDELKTCINDLRVDVGTIKADLLWIKTILSKNSNIK